MAMIRNKYDKGVIEVRSFVGAQEDREIKEANLPIGYLGQGNHDSF